MLALFKNDLLTKIDDFCNLLSKVIPVKSGIFWLFVPKFLKFCARAEVPCVRVVSNKRVLSGIFSK